MTPGQSAAADGALHLSSAVTGWTEYGAATFADSWLIACDASAVSHLRANDARPTTVAGAAVDEAGAWWAWSATVPAKAAGMATHWAECLTLLLVLRCARPDALVLADHANAISRAQDGLRQARQRRVRSWRKVEATFGRLPLVPPSAAARVQHYAGHALHRRAHRIANVIRVGEDRMMPATGFTLTAHCDAYAAGWDSRGHISAYLSGGAA